MQPQVHAFVRTAAEVFKLAGPVYEFSYCPESSEPDDGWPSQWIDDPSQLAAPAEGDVDRLEDLRKLPFPDGSARTVVCIDALEHVFEPRRAVEEMIRILAPGGMLLLSSGAEGRAAVHPDDYWRMTPGAVGRLLTGLEATAVGWQGAAAAPHTLYGLGFKGPLAESRLDGIHRFIERFQARLDEAAGVVGWWTRLRQLVAACAQTSEERRRRRDHHKAQFVVQMPVDARETPRLLASCLPESAAGSRLDLSQ